MSFEEEVQFFIEHCEENFGTDIATMVDQRINFLENLADDVRVLGVELYKTFAVVKLKSKDWIVEIDASKDKVYTILPNKKVFIGDWVE